MERIDWFTLKMKLTAGETLAEKAITLDRGKRVVAAVAVASAPGKIVDLGLYENGSQVSAPMDLDLWKKSNAGNFTDGFKPIEIKGGTEITARLFTSTALAAELEIEVVFGVIKDDATC